MTLFASGKNDLLPILRGIRGGKRICEKQLMVFYPPPALPTNREGAYPAHNEHFDFDLHPGRTVFPLLAGGLRG